MSEPEAGPSSASLDQPDDTKKRRLSHGRGPLLGDSDDDSLPDERTTLIPRNKGKHRAVRDAGWRSLTWKRVLCGVVTAIILVVVALLITLHVMLGHLWAKRLRDQGKLHQYGQNALVWQDPQSIELTRIHDDGLAGRVRFKAGIDVLGAFQGEAPLDWVERFLVKTGLRFASFTTVSLDAPLLLETREGKRLAQLTVPPLTLEMVWEPIGDWLQLYDLPFDVRVLDGDAIAAFVNASWRDRRADMRATADRVNIQLGSWQLAQRTLSVSQEVGTDLPDMPELGDLSKLVELERYTIAPLAGKQLGLNAQAVARNPLYDAKLPPMLERALQSVADKPLNIPWRLPFAVAIRGLAHSEVPMARVNILPFELKDGLRQQEVRLNLSGVFAPETNTSSTALSTFLARFLLGLDNPVVVHFVGVEAGHRSSPPAFLTPILQQYPVQLRFPGAPDDERHLLRDVKIENMRIALGDGSSDLRASGKVVGTLKLPSELAGLADAEALSIRAVLPDVYVYDGLPAPSRERGSVPGDGRPPASNAFARLRSGTYLPAKTERGKDDKGRNITVIRAELDNAPLDLLPGRSDVFRRYIGKVLFGSGNGPQGKVLTGVKGICAVNATVEGFGSLELQGLPIEGSSYIGKGDAHMISSFAQYIS